MKEEEEERRNEKKKRIASKRRGKEPPFFFLALSSLSLFFERVDSSCSRSDRASGASGYQIITAPVPQLRIRVSSIDRTRNKKRRQHRRGVLGRALFPVWSRGRCLAIFSCRRCRESKKKKNRRLSRRCRPLLLFSLVFDRSGHVEVIAILHAPRSKEKRKKRRQVARSFE